MSTSLILSARDHTLMDCLVHRVQVLNLSQVSRAFFCEDYRYASTRVKRLTQAGLLSVQPLVTRQVPYFGEPLLSWSIGQPQPAFESLSHTLLQRWKCLPSAPTSVITLGANASSLLGIRRGAGIKRALHVGHDLALSEVYLRYLSTRPELAAQWYKEERVLHLLKPSKKARGAIPDAVILNGRGIPALAIEMGGLYSPSRLEALHRSFAKKEIRYELW